MLNPYKTGLALGGLAAVVHLLWSIVIALGWGQGLLDFGFSMHSIKPVFLVQPFDLVRSIELIILAAIIGFIVGKVFAHIWNKVH